MKQKIEKDKILNLSYDIEYKNIRTKEIKNKRIVDSNWSGNDVIETHYAIFKFKNILVTLN